MDLDFCKSMPKVELHAHLNGSLSEHTLKKLRATDEGIQDFLKLNQIFELGASRTLQECFELFAVAHRATDNPEAVHIATKDVVKEFSEDGVVYLELRTTPRCGPAMTKRQYIDSVIRGIEECTDLPTIVRLLVSMDRKRSWQEAEENLELAMEYRKTHPDVVVGVDVSGDMTKGEWFRGPLERARSQSDLKVSVHCAEIPGCDEVRDILDFRPDRIGHGTCISPNFQGSQEIWQKLLDSKIPVECCLTSNVKCGTSESYARHHLQDLLAAGHPFVLATDDKGVFGTTLSRELQLAANTFQLTRHQLWQLTERAAGFMFGSAQDERAVRRALADWVRGQREQATATWSI